MIKTALFSLEQTNWTEKQIGKCVNPSKQLRNSDLWNSCLKWKEESWHRSLLNRFMNSKVFSRLAVNTMDRKNP